MVCNQKVFIKHLNQVITYLMYLLTQDFLQIETGNKYIQNIKKIF